MAPQLPITPCTFFDFKIKIIMVLFFAKLRNFGGKINVKKLVTLGGGCKHHSCIMRHASIT